MATRSLTGFSPVRFVFRNDICLALLHQRPWLLPKKEPFEGVGKHMLNAGTCGNRPHFTCVGRKKRTTHTHLDDYQLAILHNKRSLRGSFLSRYPNLALRSSRFHKKVIELPKDNITHRQLHLPHLSSAQRAVSTQPASLHGLGTN